jgi:hypothetical protein
MTDTLHSRSGTSAKVSVHACPASPSRTKGVVFVTGSLASARRAAEGILRRPPEKALPATLPRGYVGLLNPHVAGIPCVTDVGTEESRRGRPLSTRPLFVPAVYHVTISDDIAFKCNINTPSQGFVALLILSFVITVRAALQDACVVRCTGPEPPVEKSTLTRQRGSRASRDTCDNTLVLCCDTNSLLQNIACTQCPFSSHPAMSQILRDIL